MASIPQASPIPWIAGSDRTMLIWLFVLALSIRLVAMALGDNEDGDAMARLLYSRSVVDDHDFAPSTLWLPGHFYFLAIPYAMGLRSSVFPILLTAIVSALAAPFAYSLVRQFFDRTAAILSGFLIATYALHIRFSIITVSEGPFWTLILAALLCYVLYVRDGRLIYLIAGSAAFNVAGSMRFEAWIMPFLLSGSYIFSQWLTQRKITAREILRSGVYVSISLVFAAIWTAYCYKAYGDPLYLQHQTLEDSVRYFAGLPPYSRSKPPSAGYTLAFFPSVAVLSMGPVAAMVSVWGLALCIVRKQAGPLSFFVVALVMFVLSQIMLKNLIPQARYFLTICSLLLLFVGPGCADLSRRLEPRFDKRSLTYFIATVAVAWPLFIALVASFNVGWLSQKMYSLSPHPRFEKSIVDVNIWLRNNGADAGSLAFFLGGNNFAGPWSSLLDQWYGTQTLKRHELIQPHSRQIHFLREPFELITIVKEEPCGHLVVSTKFAEHRLSSDLHPMLQQQPVYVSPEFKIFAWGETCFGRPGGKR